MRRIHGCGSGHARPAAAGGFLAVALGAALLALPVPAQAAFAGANGKIVFESTQDGDFEIYAMNAGGGAQTNLTNNGVTDIHPAWSPNGTKIAFVSDRDGNAEIYVMNADGSAQTRLTSNGASDFNPAWSPDGTKIAFESARDGDLEVYTMNADGSAQVNVTNDGATDGEPAWSPDGTKIAFASSRDGNLEIYTMNADGTNPSRLTTDAAFDVGPAWSPDGTKLAFQTDRDGNDEVYVMNADGTAPANLTNNGASDRDPDWSPDGTKIAFTSDRDGDTDVFTMNADGSAQTNATNNGASDMEPEWQPVRPQNGRIAFTSLRDGNDEIYAMNADGTGQANLTSNTAIDWLPAWSPNGTKIAFTSDRDGNFDVYVMNADGTAQTRLTTNGGFDGDPAWSPDGTKIAFTSDRDGNDNVYTMNANGTGQAGLTTDAADDSDPTWSPDGTKIAFTSNRDGDNEIYTMNANGTGQTNRTSNPGSDVEPAWSPDVTKIAFRSSRDGNPEIYRMNADGTGHTNLTNDAEADFDPAWSPDGTKIAFTSLRDGVADEIYTMNADGTAPTRVTNNAAIDAEPTWGAVPRQLAIDDSSQAEGDSGATTYTFSVTRTGSQDRVSTVHHATADGSASDADNDYEPAAGDLVFGVGETTKTIAVTVNGDTKFESDEDFFVNLSSATDATLADNQGKGTIQNDDPRPTILVDDVTQREGDAGTTAFTFTVSLSASSGEEVEVSAQSEDGSATTADSDYQPLAATTVTFAPGETEKQVTVDVNGDTAFEPDEQFALKLSGAVNATIADGEGTGTIQNDDLGTIAVPAIADARVEEEHPSTNYGSSTRLEADHDAEAESYLRFDLSGISGSIKSAKLRLFATSSTGNGPAAYKTDWTGAENALTWANRTARTSSATDDKGAISSGTFVEWDVTALVNGNGPHGFVLATSSNDGVDFSSREVTDATRRPALIVTFGPDFDAPSAPPNLSAKAVGPWRVDLKWNAATDNFGVTGHKIYRDGTELATIGPQTRYSDTTTTGGTTYEYEVSALDAAGHESGRSNLVTVTAPFLFRALADARVEEAHPTTNFGASSSLRADGGSDPDVASYLRFDVTGISGPVQKAVLQLFATSHTSNGPAVFGTSNGWLESGPGSITWAGKPAPTSGPLDDKGEIPANRYVEWDVTALVNSSGLHSFMLATTSSNGVDFHSREVSLVARRPRLFVTP